MMVDEKCIDILAKTIISEEAVVRKAGGKFKMNPLFPSTVAKIKTVHLPSSPLSYLLTNTPDARARPTCPRRRLDNSRNRAHQ
jgi:hypothetical protein